MSENGDDERVVDKRAAARMNHEAEQNGESKRRDGETEPKEAIAGNEALANSEAKAEAYYKNWQRSAADFANYKKRIEQDRGEMARLAKAALVINLLPIFDDLDRAASTVDSHLAGLNWVQGVLAIHQKFSHLLEAMDVKEISAAGEPFDPAQHEAIGHQPGDEGKVIHVAQKGYTLGDKVLRPAMVIVGKGNQGKEA